MLWSQVPQLIFSSKGPALTYEIAELSARFRDEGMLAYVELIQRKEKAISCDVLTHQKWCISSLFSSGWNLIGLRFAGAVPITSIRFFQPCLQDHRARLRLVKIPQNIPSRFSSTLASARRHDAYRWSPNTCVRTSEPFVSFNHVHINPLSLSLLAELKTLFSHRQTTLFLCRANLPIIVV